MFLPIFYFWWLISALFRVFSMKFDVDKIWYWFLSNFWYWQYLIMIFVNFFAGSFCTEFYTVTNWQWIEGRRTSLFGTKTWFDLRPVCKLRFLIIFTIKNKDMMHAISKVNSFNQLLYFFLILDLTMKRFLPHNYCTICFSLDFFVGENVCLESLTGPFQ